VCIENTRNSLYSFLASLFSKMVSVHYHLAGPVWSLILSTGVSVYPILASDMAKKLPVRVM